jgi:BirA family biotin operon repressor/biotin-[acetyl-CoA-carboxylase] ligase
MAEKSESSKVKILSALSEAAGTGVPVTGSFLASSLGISRNAVWKAIHSLINDGYDIMSVQSKGYMLGGKVDILSAEAIIKEYVRRGAAGSGVPEAVPEVIILDSVDSTNNYAKELFAGGSGPDEGRFSGSRPLLIVSDEQTGGRGRYGRSFASPKGSGIYMTYVFRPLFPITDVIKATAVTASVVAASIEDICGITPSIKWVNDIYLDCGTKGLKKAVGILSEGIGSLETSGIDRMVIGIGINCFSGSDVPDEAGSLEDAGAGAFTRNDLIAGVILGLTNAFYNKASLDTAPYLGYYREHSFILGRELTVREHGGREYPAVAKSIGDDFTLTVLPSDGSPGVILLGGEVSLKL